ncbi:MAG: hypothetical protein ACO331_06385 [Prochlorothrix sp.]
MEVQSVTLNEADLRWTCSRQLLNKSVDSTTEQNLEYYQALGVLSLVLA